MENLLDVFLEIVNSDECLSFVYNNYLVSSKSVYPKTQLAFNKLKNILKLNQKELLKKYKRFKGDAFIILVKQISNDALKGATTKEERFKFLINQDIGKVENLKKLCVAIIDYPDKINSNWELIINNHKGEKYLFDQIECFSAYKVKNNDDKEHNIEKNSIINEYRNKIKLLEKEINRLNSEKADFFKKNTGINKELKNKEKELEMSIMEKKYIKAEVKKAKDDLNQKNIEVNNLKAEMKKAKNNLNQKNIEVNDLKLQLDIKNKIIENSILIDDFPIYNEREKKICIIHTMPIFMIDKIYYDIKFINYNEVYNSIEKVLKTLREQGIAIIGIQSNNIHSYRLKKIIDIANKQNLIIYRIFFNTEKELTEKILKLEQSGGLI